MTNKQLKAAVKWLGLTAKWDGEAEEWTIRIPGLPEADYFTNDKRDALGTAVDIYMRLEGLPVSDRIAKAGYFYGKALEAAGVK